MIAHHTHVESIHAVRSVRLAAHELSNVCAAIVGGTAMAISSESIDQVGEVAPRTSPPAPKWPLPEDDV